MNDQIFVYMFTHTLNWRGHFVSSPCLFAETYNEETAILLDMQRNNFIATRGSHALLIREEYT